MKPDTHDPAALSVGPVWSLHRRLAVGLILIISGALALVFPVLDNWIDREIYQRMDLMLVQRAAAVSRVLQDLDPRQLERLMPGYESGGHTEFFTVYNEKTGRVVLRSPNCGAKAVSMGPTAQGTPRYYDVILPDGHAGRALASHVLLHGEQGRLLVVATERTSWDRTEQRIHFTLLLGIVLASLLATGLALLLVQRVILMLRQTGTAVASLRADQPMQPLGADLPRELQPFVAAFNAGLQHLYAAIERERRFSRDVAHELRTPLTEIRISAETALRDTDPLHARQSLNTAIKACSRMQRTVDSLLWLARLESGQHAALPDPLDLVALLREQLVALSDTQSSRALSVQARLPVCAWVQGDLGPIEQIIANLLRNAMDYAPMGDAITCRLEPGAEGWFLLIGNAAPGLTADDLEHFGQRFWRKDCAGGTAHHAGLGLALSFALAHAAALPLHFSLEHGRLLARLGPWPALL